MAKKMSLTALVAQAAPVVAETVTLTKAQFDALNAKANQPKAPEKPKRALSFSSFATGEKKPSSPTAFQAALATGVNAATEYAHASNAMRGVSAAALREILAGIGVALS